MATRKRGRSGYDYGKYSQSYTKGRRRGDARPGAFRRPRSGGRRRNYRTGGYLGIELKFLDCAWNGVTISSSTTGANGEMQPSSGCTDCISVPAQGDGESQRDGRNFIIRSIWVSGEVDWTTLTGQTTFGELGNLFFALVLDKQANGSTIVSEDVYLNPGTSGIAMLPHPLRNLQNSKRFSILDSKTIYAPELITAQDAAGTFVIAPGQRPCVSLNWKGSIKVETSGTTADVANATDNAIHVLAYASSVQGTPVFQGKSRVRFMG